MKNQSTSLWHTAWTQDERQQLDELIAFVENYDAGNFRVDVCQYLYQLLGIDYILIGYPAKATHQVRTTVLLHQGLIQPNVTYNFLETPCRHVVDQDLYYIPFGVQSLYPGGEWLKSLQVESYLGMPLFDLQDQSLGVLVLLHRKLIERAGYVEALLHVIAPRLELEMLFLPGPASA